MRIRILAVSCFQECHNRAQVDRQLKVSHRSVNEWVKNYLNLGLGGLKANMSSTNGTPKAGSLSIYRPIKPLRAGD
ncbi:helix-turn-helix domain-containing protein [Shewanella morhuae]|uniref:helix-turn-helix domain-containing protein n=1 Tax=Shewanella morhuae TaxID=365591 RepID=UPI001BB88276|nr:helix-turn-helix domain-containing protein [Shewanella morhuae]GIU02942.1 hypothetical protein TUM4641_05990 [Shewanella morhuae]